MKQYLSGRGPALSSVMAASASVMPGHSRSKNSYGGHDDPENSFSSRQTIKQSHLRVLATNSARALSLSLSPQQREQGMPGVWLARSLVRKSKKHTSKYTTGSPKRSGIPCAMVLRLTPRSLRRSGFLSPSPVRCAASSPSSRQRRGVKTTRLCRLRPAHSSCAPLAAIASLSPTSVTIAKRPSWWARDARRDASDLPDVTTEIVCGR
jgi:hypothetical protein